MRNLLFKDFGWKLFSLLLAAFIWYTVQKIIGEPKPATDSRAEIQVEFGGMPVAIVATGADRHLFQLNSNTVTVSVSGPPERMDVLQANEIHATVDLSDFDDKSRNLTRPVEVSVPWGIRVISVAPARVRIIPPPQP